VRCRHGEIERVDRRTLRIPKVQTEIPLVLKSNVEHSLARHNLPIANFTFGPVLGNPNIEAVGKQSNSQLEPRLPTTDDRHRTLAVCHALPLMWINRMVAKK